MIRALALAAAVLAAAPAAARDLHVSTSGSGRACSADAPCALRTADSVARPGDVVHVAAGRYCGGVVTSTSGVTFLSDGAVIHACGSVANQTLWWEKGDDVVIDGFEVTGPSAYYGVWVTGSRTVVRRSYVHDVATAVSCTNQGGAGIGDTAFYGGSSDDVVDNVVTRIGPTGCAYIQGIYVETNGRIAGNLVYRVASVGIHLWHDAANVEIVGNAVAENAAGILVGGGQCYVLDPCVDQGTVVKRNVVARNCYQGTGNGIEEEGSTGANEYVDNVSVGNCGADYRLQNGNVERP